MDLDTFRNVVVVLNTIGMAVIGLVVWLRKPGEQASRAVRELRDEILRLHDDTRNRVTVMEERVQHMPTRKEFAHLEGLVSKIEAQNHAQTDRLNAISAAVARIEHYLLTKP